MAVILHAVPLSGVCRKGRPSPVPQVRARPEEMRCVGSKRTRELGRDMLLAASIVKFLVREGPWEKSHCVGGEKKLSLSSGNLSRKIVVSSGKTLLER